MAELATAGIEELHEASVHAERWPHAVGLFCTLLKQEGPPAGAEMISTVFRNLMEDFDRWFDLIRYYRSDLIAAALKAKTPVIKTAFGEHRIAHMASVELVMELSAEVGIAVDYDGANEPGGLYYPTLTPQILEERWEFLRRIVVEFEASYVHHPLLEESIAMEREKLPTPEPKDETLVSAAELAALVGVGKRRVEIILDDHECAPDVEASGRRPHRWKYYRAKAALEKQRTGKVCIASLPDKFSSVK